MIDSTQLMLILIITVLTVMLGAICFQVFFILREFRRTLAKANIMLDSVYKPVDAVISWFTKSVTRQ